MDTANIVIIGAVITALVQAIKLLGVNSKYCPVIAILLGVAFFAISGFGWFAVVMNGIIVGLTAVGLYSGAKNTYEAIKGE